MPKQFISNHIYLYFFVILFSMVLGRFALESFTILGAFVGIYLLARHWTTYFTALKDNRYLYVALAFLIPIGISLIDSLDLQMSLSVFGRMVRYLFIGVLAVVMANHNGNAQKLETISFYMLMLISLDAIMQWLTGYHIYGYNPVVGDRVFGVFYDKAHLSYFLGTFAPVVFFYLYQKIEKKMSFLRILLAIIAILILVTAILIGGARAGMISLIASSTLFIIYLFIKGKIKHKLRFAGLTLLLIVASGAIFSQSEIVQQRFESTTSKFGSDEFLSQVTSMRTNLWYVGFKEIPNYWVNGVGPRAFDKVYQTYPEDYKFQEYVWQPHLHGLEVMIETGILGFIPYLLILLFIFIRMFTANAGNVWLMMGFVAMMPINSHMGLYEGYWMTLIWPPLMIGLALAQKKQTVKSATKTQQTS